MKASCAARMVGASEGPLGVDIHDGDGKVERALLGPFEDSALETRKASEMLGVRRVQLQPYRTRIVRLCSSAGSYRMVGGWVDDTARKETGL